MCAQALSWKVSSKKTRSGESGGKAGYENSISELIRWKEGHITASGYSFSETVFKYKDSMTRNILP